VALATEMTLSQSALEVTVKFVEPPALSNRIACDPGGAPLSVCENVKEAGVVESEAVAETVSVTGTVIVVLVVSPFNTMEPEYDPTASVDPFTDTVIVAGVTPEPGATESQLPAELKRIKPAVKYAPPFESFTKSVWEAGAGPPGACENDNDAGVAVRVEVPPDTVNVTGTEMVDDPAVMVMAPWYVFAASPAPFTDTVRFAGVVALVGDTLSHVEAELTLAVKLVAPLELLTAIV
jgi:hypothetical protein